MGLLENENLIQFIKYALAGGLATVTHIIVFHLVGWKLFPCLQKKDHFVKLFKLRLPELSNKQRSRNSMFSNGIAFLLGNMVAYITNVLWVFQSGRHNIVVEILLFYAVSGVSVFLGTVLMGWLINRFGILTTYAFASNIFTSVMINYVLRKYVIFQG